MTAFTDFVAAELAKLTQVVPTPVGNVGYGTDLSCTTDLTPTMEVVNPVSTVAIAQSWLRRLTTPRGGLVDDPTYGLDVAGYLNRPMQPLDVRQYEGEIRQELLKDDRVTEAVVTVTYVNESLTVSALGTPVDPTLGPFTLTFAITGDGSIVVQELG
jgi:hypothetical protein